MEMWDGSRSLVRAWEDSRMEGEGEGEGERCCCGQEAEGHGHSALIHLFLQRQRQLRRMALFLAVGLFILVSVAVGLLITAVHGGGSQPPPPPESQLSLQTESPLPGTCDEQKQPQKGFVNPCAMLTAPTGSNTDGDFLEWESGIGNALCNGGFYYVNGSLVVPKDGIYRVFLQITYMSKHDAHHQQPLDLMTKVSYFPKSYSGERRLLSSHDTVSCHMDQWIKSLYTSGIFNLEADSRLRVTSLRWDLIAKGEDMVFFGAELLPQ